MPKRPEKPFEIPAETTANSSDRGWQDYATLYSGDIRQPWKSVYGFPITAARLAAGQTLVLHCRADEAADYLTQLNALLASPENLNRAFDSLVKQTQANRQKLARLLHLQAQPIADDEIPGLLAEIEHTLINPAGKSIIERLVYWLSPDVATWEITGVAEMLTRLCLVLEELDQVKEQGFQVMVTDRRRQLLRPAQTNGQSVEAIIDSVPVSQYHLTLWTYLIVRTDHTASVSRNLQM